MKSRCRSRSGSTSRRSGRRTPPGLSRQVSQSLSGGTGPSPRSLSPSSIALRWPGYASASYSPTRPTAVAAGSGTLSPSAAWRGPSGSLGPRRSTRPRSCLPGLSPRVERPRQRPVPDVRPLAAQDILELQKWRTVTWRRGTKGPLRASFAAMRVRVADGTPTRAGERSHQHLPGNEEVWLVGERRATGEQKYYLSNLPATTTLKTLAAAIKARWLCEQAHQQLKEELGLDHFEGRSWSGLHRHALMSMIAFLYLQHRRLRAANRGKKDERSAASTERPYAPPSSRSSTRVAAADVPFRSRAPSIDSRLAAGVGR